jgi:FkbM family methyltransferase
LTYQIFANRNARSVDREWVCGQLSPGDTYIDVGANIGSLVVPAAATVGPTGQVLAFEPSPKFADVLTTNVQLNQQTWAAVQSVALGAQTGIVYLDETAADDTTNHIATTGTRVTQAPLDEFTRDLKTIKLLKVDVEGYEVEVLKGAAQTLSKTEQILIECIPRNLNRASASVEELLELLNPHFALYRKTKDVGLTPYQYNPEATDWPDLIGINHSYVAKD